MEKLVIVLGVHRSGTSTVAGVLHNLGIDMLCGLTPHTTNQWNPKGYFETMEMCKVNDQILRDAGGNWYSFPSRDLIRNKITWPTLHQAQNLLGQQRKQKSSPLWGIKDPRMCITFPIWSRIFDYFPLPKVVIVVHRDKEAILKSILARPERDSFFNNREAVSNMVDEYVRRLELEVSEMPLPKYLVRSFNYTQILSEPTQFISDVCSVLEYVPEKTQLDSAVSHISPELNHHSVR